MSRAREQRKRARGAGCAVVAATLTALIASAPASATVTVSTQSGNTVFLDSDAQGDTIVLSCSGPGGNVRTTNGQNTTPITTTIPCASLSRLEIDGNDGGDTIQIANVTAADFPALPEVPITTGGGNDVVNASQIRDEITADSADSVTANGGNDTTTSGLGVDGGEGDDSITGATGVNAGPGDDTIMSSGGALAGGAGDDTFGSLGASNDGGPGDDVLSLEGGTVLPANFTLKLTITDTTLTVEQSLPPNPPLNQSAPLTSFERIEGNLQEGGTETFDSTAFSGTTDLRGLGGVDTFLLGPGDDVIDAGSGDDVIDGGGGFDYVAAGSGNDNLRLRDDGVDRGLCGTGADSAIADAADLLKDCESVDAPAPPPVVGPDLQDPETQALKSPRKVKRGKKAVFEFVATEDGSSFQCRLDDGALKPCGSPYPVKTKRLDVGRHFFEVTATDAAGNTDTSPLRLSFKVQKK